MARRISNLTLPARLHRPCNDAPGRPGRRLSRPRGFTIIEVVTALLLLSLALSVAVPPARDQIDRAAVRGAREAVVGMVSLARAEAMAHGEAELGLDPAGDSVWVRAGGRRVRTLRTRSEGGVDLGPNPGAVRVLSFGFLGLGRAASRTVTLRRGGIEERLTVSSYGRVRRW